MRKERKERDGGGGGGVLRGAKKKKVRLAWCNWNIITSASWKWLWVASLWISATLKAAGFEAVWWQASSDLRLLDSLDGFYPRRSGIISMAFYRSEWCHKGTGCVANSTLTGITERGWMPVGQEHWGTGHLDLVCRRLSITLLLHWKQDGYIFLNAQLDAM